MYQERVETKQNNGFTVKLWIFFISCFNREHSYIRDFLKLGNRTRNPS